MIAHLDQLEASIPLTAARIINCADWQLHRLYLTMSYSASCSRCSTGLGYGSIAGSSPSRFSGRACLPFAARLARSDKTLIHNRSSGSASSAFRKTFLASLYFVLPPRFAPALQAFFRTLLTYTSPAAAVPPSFSRALPTLITLLDRFDPLLFALIYEEIESKIQSDCRGAYTASKLEPLLKWLNGAGSSSAGKSGGVMGWVSGIYEGGAGEGGNEEARKFLKPTFSRFEYHVHKVLCQLRCATTPCRQVRV